MSHSDWFRTDPCAAWGFYGHRCQLYATAEPHQGFTVLRSIARNKHGYFVFTSNIDSHFQKSGFDDSRLYEAHGTLRSATSIVVRAKSYCALGTLSVLQCVNEECTHVWSVASPTPVTLVSAMQGP